MLWQLPFTSLLPHYLLSSNHLTLNTQVAENVAHNLEINKITLIYMGQKSMWPEHGADNTK
jgi:hypothetical protein